MPDLPARPNLDQLRHQARDLLRDARRGGVDALARIRAVSDRLVLASAQLAIAREHGFASWAKLKLEVERRDVLNQRDVSRLADLLARHPETATTRMEGWSDHRKGADVLGYLAMLRLDHRRLGLPRDLPGSDVAARALIDAGAPVDGHPGDQETPLITAASCGDVDVAKVLIEAGADLDAVAAPDSGGVPGGTAVEHAAVFGMTDVLDLLVAAGARVDSPEMAAAAGDLTAWPPRRLSLQCRLRCLVFAADHQRLEVIDRLVAAGTPVDEADAEWQRMPLHVAAANGKPAGVRRMLDHGADPALRDPRHLRTPLEWCRLSEGDSPGHAEVAALLVEQMKQDL
ncbi:ankyrin repeat domain-containing protein [Saccharothrix luteola]|uniref:ankyrin repeat domain-containing protein n=1 Tax=Saccharothrix luteola TaxID=2893018 RepID=UPI001E4F4C98|nr:ankyrin repeat domain-containing protein [Saccharothrix luteola]MCC8249172.1 ankyrin repeat domain-containing protein [Saccharothrix luteola]